MKKSFYSISIAAIFLSAVFVLCQPVAARALELGNFASAGTPTCTPLNIILDGGFETGGVPSTIWIDPQSSTNFGTPLCTDATCGTGSGASPPRSGTTWAWFGGIPLPETAKLGQNITIPSGTASLRFWMRIGTVSAPFTDVLNIKIDNVTVQSYIEPSAAELAYTERIVDLSAFANGGLHNIQFEYIGSSNGTGSYVVDDVTLLASGAGCASPSSTPTSTPTSTGTPACTPSDRIADSTFEAGNPWTAWTVQTSTIFGTPICDTVLCGTDSGTAAPFAGNNWIWFGGSAAAETATVGQSVTIPAGAPATLTFQLRIGKVVTPFTDTLTVTIDGTTITTITEPVTAEAAYTLRTFDISSFADGGSHAILFTYNGPTTGAANFTVDNVSLIAGGVCSTPTPSNTPTTTPTATPSAMISGNITYGNSGTLPPPFVSNVLISGIGSPDVSTTTVFPTGNYELTGFGSGSYIVTPSKTGGVNGSITSFDAGRVSQHVAGVITLNGNQLSVADVSGNGSISSFDAAQIARYAAAVPGTGSTGNWIFIPASRNYLDITSVITGEDYVAYIMGEVSGNWTNTSR